MLLSHCVTLSFILSVDFHEILGEVIRKTIRFWIKIRIHQCALLTLTRWRLCRGLNLLFVKNGMAGHCCILFSVALVWLGVGLWNWWVWAYIEGSHGQRSGCVIRPIRQVAGSVYNNYCCLLYCVFLSRGPRAITPYLLTFLPFTLFVGIFYFFFFPYLLVSSILLLFHLFPFYHVLWYM